MNLKLKAQELREQADHDVELAEVLMRAAAANMHVAASLYSAANALDPWPAPKAAPKRAYKARAATTRRPLAL